MLLGSVNIYVILSQILLWMKTVHRQLTHRFAAYCALLAIVCQLLLPFAHAAAMRADVNPAWCGTGAKAPSMSFSSASAQGDDAGKMMFCPVCAAASVHAIAPPAVAYIVAVLMVYTAIELPAHYVNFAYQSYAIPPPPRGPPDFLNA